MDYVLQLKHCLQNIEESLPAFLGVHFSYPEQRHANEVDLDICQVRNWLLTVNNQKFLDLSKPESQRKPNEMSVFVFS